MFVFQLPARPTAARVRTWRQLQRLGALSVRNSGYVLPFSDQSREDFEWLRTDIKAAGGDAMLFDARTLDAAAETELIGAFRAARRQDFDAIRRDAAAVAGRRAERTRGSGVPPREARALGERLERIEAMDLFGGSADARAAARAAVNGLIPALGDAPMPAVSPSDQLKSANFKRRTWVTRPRPGIDRFASAWLIRRFIDSGARFAFARSVAEAGRRRRAITFDMYGGTLTHEAGRCTFETIAARFNIRAAGIDWLARLVHALDLKVEAEAVAELPAVARLVDGLRSMHTDDRVLLERGIELVEALYRSRLAETPSQPAKQAPKRRTARGGR